MNPLPVIRMFALCEAFKWSFLPNAGGLYDQHPDLLDAFRVIFSARSKYEHEQAQKRDREQRRSRAKGRR